jgi:hypothetical protein
VDLLAREFQSWAEQNPPPTSQFNAAVADRGRRIAEDVSAPSSDGARRVKTYRADARQTYAFAGLAQQPVVCGVLQLETEYTPRSGAIVQPVDQSVYPILAPGHYRRVVMSAIDEVCIIVTAGGVGWPAWTNPIDVNANGDRA